MRLSQKIVIGYIRTKFSILSAFSKRSAAQSAFALFCTPQYRNRKKLPPVFERSEKLRFSFEGHTIQGYRWNHPAENKVLILHGFESSVINFDRYVKPLVSKGFEVLAFDAPAHGRSTGGKITVVLYKNLIHAIQQAYGPVHNFMAHSLGGLALSLYLEEAEDDPSWKAVLIAPAAETTTAIDSFFRFLQLDTGVRKHFDKLIQTIGGQPPSWYSVGRAAPGIRARVLWMQDKDDTMTPYADMLPVMEKNLPNFRFVISEGLGHRRIYRDNKTTKAIIEFLGVTDLTIDANKQP